MDSNDYFEVVKCNLCGADDPTTIIRGKDKLYKKPGLFNVLKCNKCGLMYTNPRPDQKIISKYYPPEFWGLNEFEDNNKLRHLKNIFQQFNQILINLISHKMSIPFKTGGKLLDIGCGKGEFLFEMKNKGWETYGIELSEVSATYAKEKFGLNIFRGTLEEASYPDKFFDGITLHQVLEHLPDPTLTLLEVRRIIKDKGLIAISVPDASSLDSLIFKENWYPWEVPRHFYHFSPETINLLLEKTGFEVLRITHDCHPGGILLSIKYFFEDKGLNPLIGSLLVYPLVYPLSFINGKLGRSGSMAVYAKKKTKKS